MPQPHGPRRPNPEDLARDIARRLAESRAPSRTRFSLRNSLIVGRLVAGLMVLGTAAVIILGTFAGVDWLLDQGAEVEPEVLSAELRPGADATSLANPTMASGQTLDLLWLLGTESAAPPAGPRAPSEPTAVIGVAMPTPTSPASTFPGDPGSSPTRRPSTTSPVVTTTQPSTSSTSAGPTTTALTPITSPMPTMPGTTTTISPPTTATTIAPTTTLIEITTTLFEDTTTTCGNNGNGKGNC